MFGPTGIGVLYAKEALLEDMPPYQGGGEMITDVRLYDSKWAPIPHKFEAGTPPIAQAIGFGAAIDYLDALSWEAIREHESGLLEHTQSALRQMPEVRLVGEPAQRAGAVSFVVEGSHPHDIGTILDTEGVAVRAGHHCAQPVMDRFGLPATARAS